LTQADLEAARTALSGGEASRDLVVWELANRRFHRSITTPCGMPRLMRAIDDLHQASARFLLATWKDLDWQPRSDAEHRAIVDSIDGDNIERAANLLREHILSAGLALAQQLEADASG